MLWQLAGWLEELRELGTTGAEESLFVAAYVLASDPGWDLSVDERLRFYADAVDYLEVLGNREDNAAWIALQAAILLQDEGRLPEACTLLEETLERFGQATERKPSLLLNLAEWKRALGHYEEALRHTDDFETSALASGSVNEALWVRLHLIRGQTNIELGLPVRAAPAVREGLRMAEERYKSGAAPASELVLAQRIDLWLAKSTADHEGALNRIEEYLADENLYPEGSSERAQLLCMAGTSALDLEASSSRSASGRDFLLRSLAMGLPPATEAHARFALAEDALVRAAFEEAQGELESVGTLIERWRGTPSLRDPFLESATLAALEVRLAVQRGEDHDRLRELVEPIESALEDLLERWAQTPELEGGVGFLLYGRRRAVVGALVRLTIELDSASGPEEALMQLLRVQGQGSLARRDRAPTPKLSQIQAPLVGSDGGVLAYLPSDGASHVFAIDGEGVRHALFAPGDDVEQARSAYLSHLTASVDLLNNDDVRDALIAEERRLAVDLAGLLFPVEIREQIAAWSEITIVGSDLLGMVPFAWLPIADRDYIGLEAALTYQHSIPLSVARAQRPRPKGQTWDLLLLTGVEPTPELRERWPEVGELPAHHPGLLDAFLPERVHTLSGASATLAALTETDASSARVFQFLGHGIQDHGLVRPSALVLQSDNAHDGLLWCSDAEQLPSPELVILTACRSGRGPQRRGDPGATDMSGAWLSGGARATVLALSELTYGRALDASRALHRELRRGESPAEGLRAARVELFESQGAEAPFRDGLVRVIGLGHEPLFPKAEPRLSSSLHASDAPTSSDASGDEGSAPQSKASTRPYLWGGGALALGALAFALRRARRARRARRSA